MAGIWFAFQNGLPPNSNNGFHLQKITRNKIIDKTDKNSFLHFQYVLLKSKTASLVAVDCCLRKWKEMVSTSPKISFHQLKHGLSLKTGFH